MIEAAPKGWFLIFGKSLWPGTRWEPNQVRTVIPAGDGYSNPVYKFT
jgi:hypothetical protein